MQLVLRPKLCRVNSFGLNRTEKFNNYMICGEIRMSETKRHFYKITRYYHEVDITDT